MIVLQCLGRAVALQPALVAVLCLAGLLALFWSPSLPSTGLDLTRPVRITGRIASAPRIEREPDQIVFELEPLEMRQGEDPIDRRERMALYLSSVRSDPQTWFDPPLRFGEVVRFRSPLREPAWYRVPGVPDHRWERWAGGVYFYASLKSPAQLERLGCDDSLPVLLLRPVVEYLEAFRAACRRRMSRPAGDLLAAALTGDRRGVPPQRWDQLERLSLVHLLVISGFHVGLLAWLLGLAANRWAAPGLLLRLAAVWAFAGATGGAAPVARAALVLSLVDTGRLLGLRRRRFNILGAAALLLLLDSPRLIYSRSFQFTFLSVVAILVAAPLLGFLSAAAGGASDVGSGNLLVRRDARLRWRRAVRYRLEAWFRFVPDSLSRAPAVLVCRGAGYLAAAAVVTVSIQLVLAPLLLYHTNQWTVTAAPNNVVALPLFTLFFLSGLGLFLLHATPAAGPAAVLADLPGRLFLDLLDRLDTVNATLYLPAPGPGLLTATFLLLAAGLVPGRQRFWAILAVPLLLACGLGLRTPETRPQLAVTLLDVGQAEAIHLRYPDGSSALVDTGGSHFARGNRFLGRRVVARYLLAQGARHLEFVLITHPEADHLGTLPVLSRIVPPRVVYHFAPLPFPTPASAVLKAGDSFEIGAVQHRIHAPPAGSSLAGSANAHSIVMELRFGDFSMLLTGDIDDRVERSLIPRLRAIDILKVAHHGSRSGSSGAFLAVVRPRVAVVSAGRNNRFGHPSPVVAARLERRDCPLFSTLQYGSLRIETDGRSWSLAGYDAERSRFLPLAGGPCRGER